MQSWFVQAHGDIADVVDHQGDQVVADVGGAGLYKNSGGFFHDTEVGGTCLFCIVGNGYHFLYGKCRCSFFTVMFYAQDISVVGIA